MTTNAVIDISHHNGVVQLALAKADGIVGVIQKATQGLTYTDGTFATNRASSLATGLLFGAYHFGDGSDGVAQAEHFLNVVKPDATTLVALDFEDNKAGPSMTLEEARAFVIHVKEALGRWPVLYSGHTIKAALGTHIDPVLKNCPLWLAQYGATPIVPPCWASWTLWQYTDGGLGPQPHSVNGVGPCDRDKFNGDEAALRGWWAS